MLNSLGCDIFKIDSQPISCLLKFIQCALSISLPLVEKAKGLAARNRVGVEIRLLTERDNAVALSLTVEIAVNLLIKFHRLNLILKLTLWRCERQSGWMRCQYAVSRLFTSSCTYLSQMAKSFLPQRKRTCRSWFSAISCKTTARMSVQSLIQTR